MIPICTISLRFFSPPEKPTFTGRLSISMLQSQRIGLRRAIFRNSPPKARLARALRWLERVAGTGVETRISTGY
jgi:hypothetical protein